MLTNIENRLEELFEQIETMPQDKVEAAEKVSVSSRFVCCTFYAMFFFFLPKQPQKSRSVD